MGDMQALYSFELCRNAGGAATKRLAAYVRAGTAADSDRSVNICAPQKESISATSLQLLSSRASQVHFSCEPPLMSLRQLGLRICGPLVQRAAGASTSGGPLPNHRAAAVLVERARAFSSSSRLLADAKKGAAVHSIQLNAIEGPECVSCSRECNSRPLLPATCADSPISVVALATEVRRAL